MAINTQKFLPSIKKETETLNIKKSSIVLSQNSVKNIATIKVKVIQIESILKGTLASEKKALDQKKRKESSERREKQEEKLETKTNMGMGQVKMPSRPRLGIFDWIKNFIGNIILGYFAVRLVDHLPKIMPIVKLLGKAGDFIVDFGGKLLNGLATFIDWGYKAVDFSRGLIGKTFGDDALKNFDKLTSEFEKFMNLAIIVGMASADFGMDRMRRSGPTGPTRGGTRTRTGGAPIGGPDIRNPLRERPRITEGRSGQPSAPRLPGTGPRVTGSGGGGPRIRLPGIKARGGLLGLVFLIPDLIQSGMLMSQGRGKDGLRTLLSAVSGVAAGMAAYSATIAGAAALGITGVGLPAAIALALAGFGVSALAGTAAFNLTDAGLRKLGLVDNDPSTGKPYVYKGGGRTPTRGGKSKGSVRRTIGKTKKTKYKRVVPQKPGRVEITSPGADIGGEDKLFGIFPNPLKGAQKVIDAMNPFNTIKKSGEELGKTDYFGPILAITSKLLVGQKPSQQDYENVGLGINMLIAKGIQDKQLKGGVVAAFAEGGMVDPDVLSAAETGGDISNWVAKTFQGEIESNAQRTLRLIKENAEKKKEGSGEGSKPTEDEMPQGTGALIGNTNAEKVFNYLIGYGFTEQAAAGVIGNLMQESGVNPQSRQLGGGPGRGIMQWGTGPGSGGRWDALSAWAASSGKDPWKLDTQVEWMMKEMRSYGTLNRLKGVTDVKKAVEIFESEMEKAGTPNYPRRYQYAADALASFGGGKAGGMGIGKMDKGGIGGAVAEYITGDPNTSFGRFDKAGHGLPSNYHDHIAFKDRGTAVRAYNFFKSKGIQVTEFKGFNPVGGHASGSYHYSGLAFDIPGAQWGGSGAIGPTEYSGSSKVRRTLKEFLGTGPLAKPMYKGGRINGPTLIKGGEKGPEYMLDSDTTTGLDSVAPGLAEKLNMAKTKPQLASILQQYASYESGAEQTVVVVDSPSTNTMSGNYGDSSGIAMMMGGSGAGDDPFESLHIGG